MNSLNIILEFDIKANGLHIKGDGGILRLVYFLRKHVTAPDFKMTISVRRYKKNELLQIEKNGTYFLETESQKNGK